MSRAEFEDYLLQLDRERKVEPSKEDSVEKLIGSIKSGEMDVEDLTLDQMKLICDIGWDMGQRWGPFNSSPLPQAESKSPHHPFGSCRMASTPRILE
jgi:hypothetical protein